ncbi:hypothetical protein [Nonomuraea roseoviolacea]|uniref:Phage tail protein n=1 Tax=Nonomuraea roseoviolacea subsp. carminata TaxID=160689 RepID=A0ABT1KC99_9ACTN|nr:hypothetical protein [Nonomuraea roseoviolacea]MCP2350614.1 hypothetical protein [Nonomuraea roseoviolacea subsp. carminata]
MARGNPNAIALGPGRLFIAPLGTTEPTDLTTPWETVSVAWVPLGYTDEGSNFTYSVDSETVNVAEELDPIAVALTAREGALAFALAEMTAKNMQRALNGGSIVAGTGIVTFEPPDLGEEVRVMLGWESEDGEERWIYRKALQTGGLDIARRKGAEKAVIPCEFKLEKPAAAKLFKVIFDEARAA